MADLPDPIDPAAMYRVEMARIVTVDGVRLPVRGAVTVRGDLLTRVIDQEGADSVRSALLV